MQSCNNNFEKLSDKGTAAGGLKELFLILWRAEFFLENLIGNKHI